MDSLSGQSAMLLLRCQFARETDLGDIAVIPNCVRIAQGVTKRQILQALPFDSRSDPALIIRDVPARLDDKVQPEGLRHSRQDEINNNIENPLLPDILAQVMMLIHLPIDRSDGSSLTAPSAILATGATV